MSRKLRTRFVDNYGILGLREWLFFTIVIIISAVLVGSIVYYAWWMDEQVNLSFTCEELSYAIKNMEADSQMRFHYKDRCLG